MPNPDFLQPKINKIIHEDPQIQKVNLEFTEWGSRKSLMDKDIKNSMSISHVGGNLTTGQGT